MQASTSTPDLSTTVLRISLGILFLAHGLVKVFVFTIPGTIQFFEASGLPGLLAVPVTLIEVLGGIMLIVGVFTRWAAVAMVPLMIGATTIHWSNGWMFSNEGGGWEFTAFLTAASLALFLRKGDGAFALGSRFSKTQS